MRTSPCTPRSLTRVLTSGALPRVPSAAVGCVCAARLRQLLEPQGGHHPRLGDDDWPRAPRPRTKRARALARRPRSRACSRVARCRACPRWPSAVCAQDAFAGCSSLKEVTVPASVTEIGYVRHARALEARAHASTYLPAPPPRVHFGRLFARRVPSPRPPQSPRSRALVERGKPAAAAHGAARQESATACRQLRRARAEARDMHGST